MGKEKMGLFKGIREASVGGNNVYFEEGLYKVKVLRAFTMKSRKKADLAIVECQILESDNPSRPAGSKASWVVNLVQDAALGNIKAFVAAASGIDPSNEDEVNEQVTEEAAELAFNETNPLADVELSLQCTAIKTKAGGDFTKHFWSPIA